MSTAIHDKRLGARQPGFLQGWTLVASAWLAVFASGALIGPILPRMSEHFRSVPHVEVLISLVATLPSLFVALLAVPFGMLADRVGHRRVLFWATLLYGLLGMAPYGLDALPAIVVSRAGVGIAEAAIMTCGAALIGRYFRGQRSARWYALQTGTAPIAALIAIALGGGLGERDWHTPFLVYSFGLVLFVAVTTLLWEPGRAAPGVGTTAAEDARIRWPRLLGICAITLFALSAFLVTVIQTGFLLTERGIPSPRLIGLGQALASLANPAGALLFGLWRAPARSKLTLSLLLMGAGFAVIGLEPSWQAALGGAAITNLGCGMILPTLITWALEGMPDAARGRGTGTWMCASFLGQFISPLSIVWLKQWSGSLSGAVLCYAIACAAAGLIALLSRWSPWRSRFKT
ncbi:MAG: MFS transporter [Steroidobacteraceae bacterium]|jgi:MFS family permease